MPNPKSKTSKSRQRKRRTHIKLIPPTTVLCPQCHEAKLPHQVCVSCGMYKRRQVIEVKD